MQEFYKNSILFTFSKDKRFLSLLNDIKEIGDNQRAIRVGKSTTDPTLRNFKPQV